MTENKNNVVVSLTTYNIKLFSPLKIEENKDCAFYLVTLCPVSPQLLVDSPHFAINTVCASLLSGIYNLNKGIVRNTNIKISLGCVRASPFQGSITAWRVI